MVNKEKILGLFSLEGQVAIVTGGAGDLGRRHIEILRKAGAKPVSFDVVKNKQLDGVADQILVDVSNSKAVQQAVKQVAKRYKKVDILINNAAFLSKVRKDAGKTDEAFFSPYEIYSEKLWSKELAVNISGAQFCTQAVAPFMIKQKKGCIINITSTSSITAPNHGKYKKGRFKSVGYPTTKTALLGLTRAWASYFAAVSPGVRVNAVSFGAINFGLMDKKFVAKLGERNMIGRPANPDEYQGVILFLCSKAASFITASNLVADGGQTAW